MSDGTGFEIMQVEIWSDVICPWCGLGTHRFVAALRDFDHRDDVEVVHRSFQLGTGLAEGEVRPVRELLATRYGMSDAQVTAANGRIEAMAEAEGLRPYIVTDNVAGNTALTHELLFYAREQGLGEAAWERLFTAYFGEVRPVFDIEALVELAGEIGLDPEATRDVLASRRYAAAVAAEGAEATALGATGVPFIVIDRAYALAGAQNPDVIGSALETAWAAKHPAPLTDIGEADAAACGPDGCELPGAVRAGGPAD